MHIWDLIVLNMYQVTSGKERYFAIVEAINSIKITVNLEFNLIVFNYLFANF